MESIGFSDLTARLIATYAAQLVMGLTTAYIFYYFSRTYKRSFLQRWSLSWLGFSMHMLGLLLYTLFNVHGSAASLAVAVLSQTGAFMQVSFLLAGTWELIRNTTLSSRSFFLIMAITIALAFISSFAYHQVPDAFYQRYLLRYGLRELLIGLGFSFASIVVWINPIFSRGVGQKLLASCFLFFSIQQFYYLSIVLINTFGGNASLPSFFGLVDLLLIALIAMSMVMWLLEDERIKLARTNKELDSFLYSTSHDLRAPIASILGLTNLARFEVTDAKALEYMHMIDGRIKKLDHVIGDILTLSRSKKADIKIEVIDFNAILKDVVSDVKFNEGAASITLDYTENSPHVFKSDYNQMKMILANLISNAVKYHNLNQSNPVIRVKFLRVDKRVEISVEDNGMGITKESLPRIFEMFYRGTTSSEGTGLGLYIVKEAVTNIKGTISVKSEVKKGTTFTIVLPNA